MHRYLVTPDAFNGGVGREVLVRAVTALQAIQLACQWLDCDDGVEHFQYVRGDDGEPGKCCWLAHQLPHEVYPKVPGVIPWRDMEKTMWRAVYKPGVNDDAAE